MTTRAVGRFEAALGVIGLAALATTYVLITGRNPLAKVGDWLTRTGSLADPAPAWTHRLDDQPTTATVTGGAIVFATRDGVEVRDAGTGRALWSRGADSAAVAGDSVIVRTGGGYEVVDPTSGATRWRDSASVVWTYRDAVLAISCPKECVLSRRSPVDGVAQWKAALPSGARVLSSADRGGDLPPAVGLPVDGRLYVIDTATGARLRQEQPDADTRVSVLGGRIVRSTVVRRGDGCRFAVEGRDPASGRTIWKKDGYDLGTGCGQRRDPVSAGGVLTAVRADDRPVALSVGDGRELWVGAPGETLLGTDGRYALVRAGRTITVVDVAGGPRWSHELPAGARARLTPYAVVVDDGPAGRVVGYDVAGGATLVDVATQGSAIGGGPGGLVLGRGRTVGFVPFAASAP